MKQKPGAPNIADAQSDLGPRLRAIRLAPGLGLRELARRLDLSPSAISQIETGKIQPVRAHALCVGVGVRRQRRTRCSSTSAASPTDGAARSAAGSSPTAAEPGLAVQRADGATARSRSTPASRGSGSWSWADDDIEFLEATYEPGGASSPDDAFVRHSGHEFGYVLERDAARDRRIRRVRARARRLDHVPVVDAAPAQQRRRTRPCARDVGRARPPRRGTTGHEPTPANTGTERSRR